MTIDEATEQAAKLKGLMPMITDEQLKDVTRAILPLSAERTWPLIQHYARTRTEFNLAAFLTVLPSFVDDRVTMSADRTKQELHKERILKQNLDAEFAEIDRVIEQLSDEELEAHKAAVIEEHKLTDGDVSAILEKLSARTSMTLKRRIFARLQAAGGAVA